MSPFRVTEIIFSLTGVVYSEMEIRQNTDIELCTSKLLEMLHPEGSGYRAITGGKLENLRKLTNHAVKKYHAEFYRPENLCIIITGQVNKC